MPNIRVVDFVQTPGGRYAAETEKPDSGEHYRDLVLVPALRQAISRHETLTVELDGVAGYGSSFLDEAFGGLIRHGKFSRDEVRKYLIVVARERLYAPYEMLARQAIERAEKCIGKTQSQHRSAGSLL